MGKEQNQDWTKVKPGNSFALPKSALGPKRRKTPKKKGLSSIFNHKRKQKKTTRTA
jgi:hypothetical protein